MPELPEVETIVRGLRAALVGSRLESVEVVRASVFGGVGQAAAIEGAELAAIARAGKYMVLRLERDGIAWQLMVHLGMTGQLRLERPEQARARHTHVVFGFAQQSGRAVSLHFRDPRRFGRIALAPAPDGIEEFAPALGIAPGAEPLEISAAAFVALFRHRAAPIKNALLNQRLLRGVGNIYADESLFRAGIDPRASRLSPERLLRLRRALRSVLRAAIAAGGSSISDYVASDGEPGRFHLEHRVYGREGEPCVQCGRRLRRITLGGRSSHFCGHCQT